MNKNLIKYYASRAEEYEQLYVRLERQQDLRRMSAVLQDIFRNKTVLEIACGTGWFTHHLAQSARSILATDINESMLEIARSKNYPPEAVEFCQDDIYNTTIDDQFDGLFAGFIWSHILLEQLDIFLQQCLKWLRPGSLMVFTDNLFVPGSSTPIHQTDPQGNSYQLRRLKDGSEHLVLKNFPSPEFLQKTLDKYAAHTELILFDNYWMAICQGR